MGSRHILSLEAASSSKPPTVGWKGKGKGYRFFGSNAKIKRYTLFSMESREKIDDVGIFVVEKWADSDVSPNPNLSREL